MYDLNFLLLPSRHIIVKADRNEYENVECDKISMTVAFTYLKEQCIHAVDDTS